jgi:hypothetical protein
MSRPEPSSFDRLRPRAPMSQDEPDWAPAAPRPQADGTGKRALFSVSEPETPAFGSVSIDCSSCHQVSVLALRQAIRVAIPSLYLPVLRGRYPAWLHCPACYSWTWTRVKIRI